MLELIVLLLAPAAGGAGLYHLWLTLPHRPQHGALAVGQVPLQLRRHAAMAVRRGGVKGCGHSTSSRTEVV
ncbi:hypothetical protein [Stenotrophomonas sp. B1-1]|uniref:hypothetical protein n=1 Tax=Stenotrophomonas sp. B1-1 TaxID=2710648 RepID=UPI0013DCF8E9|nr:hypothetical protein [Stenotrophomonas sp. B1-1]